RPARRLAERAGPGAGPIQIEGPVGLARLDFRVLPPLVPARNEDPVRAAVERGTPLRVIVSAIVAGRDARGAAVEQAPVVVARAHGGGPDPADAVLRQQRVR